MSLLVETEKLRRAKRSAEAEQLRERQLKSRKHTPLDDKLLARVYWDQRRAKQAVEAYSRYLDVQQFDVEALLSRAKIYAEILMARPLSRTANVYLP